MNKAILLPLFLLILLPAGSQLLAQKCGLDHLQHQLITEQAGYQQELLELEEQVLESQNSAQYRNTYNIPVVIHVINKGESIGTGTNISDARILSQLEILNEDFQRLNADASNTPSTFAGVAADTNIEFCLASIDPSGNPTSGITRDQYNNVSSISYIANTVKPNTIWAPLEYLNIWVLQMPDASILGYSFLPTATMVGSNRDGLVVDYRHFGDISSSNKGRTATHELGHYLGLKHMWGDNDSNGNPIGCSSDDGISDTPNCDGPYYNCPSFGLQSCSSTDMHMNYMDYVNDNCMNLFTEGQAAVMQSILSNQRAALAANANSACNVECVNLSTTDLTMGFETGENTSGWLIENANADNFTWTLGANSNNDYGPETGDGFALYLWNSNAAADDYLFSPCFSIKANEIYELEFSYAAARDANQLYPEAFEVGFSFAQNSSDFQVPSADWQFDPVTNSFPDYNTATLRFYNTSDATLSLGFHVFSPADQYAMQLDNIQLRYTGLTDTEEVAQIDNFLISPNPAQDLIQVNLEFAEAREEVEIVLQDVTGRIIDSKQLTNVSKEKLRFNLDGLPQGIYLVTVVDGDSAVTKKVTKI